MRSRPRGERLGNGGRRSAGLVALALVLAAALALLTAPAGSGAPSPELEFATPGGAFPVPFTASGGQVTAVLADFDTVVHCAASSGAGLLTGPRSTTSHYVFTGCETEGGSDGGAHCHSQGAEEDEIRSGEVAGDLAFINQARGEAGILLAPHGGTYLSFECGGESVKAIGPFLSPVGPLNQETGSFTASLFRSGASQLPAIYEGPAGEILPAVPSGEKGSGAPVSTGVELSFAIRPQVPVTVKAVSSAEVEARQRAEAEAAAAAERKHQEEATATASRRHQEEEADTRKLQEEEAVARRQQEERASEAKKRARQRSKALKQCRRTDSRQKRIRCETKVKRHFQIAKASART